MNRLFVACLLLASLCVLPAQETVDNLQLGAQAEKAENFQRAIELYQAAAKAAPDSPEPSRALARLYASQGLHRMALPAWEDVLRKVPEDRDSWLEVAQTHGFLNEDAQAVAVYEKALARFPTDLDLAQALSWMLFKTEKFAQGIHLLEDLTKGLGTNASVEMVLGTLYSSQYDEAQARVHYLQSIAMTTGNSFSDKTFRSIAWYNLSLLDKSFYHFSASEEDLQNSLAQQERSANHLALGELQQGALQEKAARKSFEKALESDDTPLSQFDLAKLDQQFGHLDLAKSEAAQVAAHADESWIFNFGVTKDKFLRDQEELQADLHHDAWLMLDFQPRTTVWDWLVWVWKKLEEGLQWYFHDQQWKSLLVKTSNTSLQVSNSSEAWVSLTLANRDHPAVGLKYLALSRDHELPRNPLSAPSYALEEALISNDEELLKRSLKQLQTPGENSDKARALVRLAHLQSDRGARGEARRSLTTLYELSPGVMPAEGLALPVKSAWFGTDAAEVEAWKRTEADYARQSGWDLAGNDRSGVTWSLDVQVFTGQQRQIYWTLRDASGNSKKSGNLTYQPEKKMEALASIFFALHASD